MLEDIQSGFRTGIAGHATPSVLRAPDPAEVERRFAVYRNNVIVSLTNALRQRFPVVERLVGEEFSRAMFGVFARQHPPRSRLMMEYGDNMSEFLENFPPALSLPYLPDIARLEYARGRAYHSADAGPVAHEGLAEAAARGPDTFGLELHPSVTVLSSRYPVYSIWSRDQPGQQRGQFSGGAPQDVLVARAGLDVVTRPLSPADAAFTAALREGAHFAEAAEAAITADTAFDPAPVLVAMLRDGLITAVTSPSGG